VSVSGFINARRAFSEVPYQSAFFPLAIYHALRWLIAFCQMLMLLVAGFVFEWSLPYLNLLFVVLIAVLINLGIGWLMARRIRTLSDGQAFLFLCGDVIHITCLLLLLGMSGQYFLTSFLVPLFFGCVVLSSTRYAVALFAVVIVFMAIVFGTLFQSAIAPLLPVHWLINIITIFVAAMAAHRGVLAQRRWLSAAVKTVEAYEKESEFSKVGALAAAVVHELATPLSTIAVVTEDFRAHPVLQKECGDDLALLQDQVTRCKKILATLGRSPEPGLFDFIDWQIFIKELCRDIHANNIELIIDYDSENFDICPRVSARPELSYALRNLLQNAFGYARREVYVFIEWHRPLFRLTIVDDGVGFDHGVLPLLGEPFLSVRQDRVHHLGLGIYTAIHLLASTGGAVTFENARDGGARVVIEWSHGVIL
jgi:two-component system, sensor histidine kinase RegB